MNFRIFSIFVFITLTFGDNLQYKTFNEWHEMYKENHLNDENSIKINQKCVERKLNFQSNGEKKMNHDLGLTTIGLAYNLCNENNKEIGKVAIGFLMIGITEDYATKTDCFKKALKEIEPNAKIVKNFDESQMTNSNKECEETLGSEKFDKFLSDVIEKTSIGEHVCDKITKDDIKSFAYRLPIMNYGNLSNIDEEFDICGEIIHNIQIKAFECKIEEIYSI
ncbi:hypothetical protein PVAND_014628 [Polypedilum vanderplanki]|uniref:Uncharacterized protein n=1 Tax=Polypedilum vanderplanki TaxID=319348 RepID=A0A9J6B9Y0_POLVA|nr:hypothetical protein PVAND_014628 [Polypedilum vanderplanki]